MTNQAFQKNVQTNNKKLVRLLKKGKNAYLKHQYNEAQQYILKAEKIAPPDHADVYELHARIEFELKNYSKAYTLINTAINLIPKDWQLYSTKGLFLTLQKAFPEAIEVLHQSIELNNLNNPAILYLAEIYMIQGKNQEAYLLLKSNMNNLSSYKEKYEALIKHSLENMSSLRNPPLDYLYQDLIDFLDKENTSLSHIGRLCYTIINLICQRDGHDLRDNGLLIKAMTCGIITDCQLELYLVNLRKNLLVNNLSNLNISAHDLPMVSALAVNGYFNEYIFFYDDEEETLIVELSNIIRKAVEENATPDEISGFLLLYAMYAPIEALGINDYLISHIHHDWPVALETIIQWGMINPSIEHTIKQQLETVAGGINDAVSAIVKQQYEENPYPRWVKLHYPDTPCAYIRTSRSIMTNVKNYDYLNGGKLEILVAGCGTGEHPLNLAAMVENCEITAIDISKASLAYASRMAAEYGILNVNFKQADILNLSQLEKKFHIIETVGVLHHMQNPEQGLAVLRELLVPGGIMKIGLYSEIARKEIYQLRNLNKDIRMAATAANIRHFRFAVLQNPESEYHEFTRFMDFYSTSSCRDLLFHEQEHSFTIPKIKMLLDKYRLRFLGFTLPSAIYQQYTQQYPEDCNTINLDNWNVFEQQNPDTFKSMYQFHCQTIE